MDNNKYIMSWKARESSVQMFPGEQNRWHWQCIKEKQKDLWTLENILKSLTHVLTQLEPVQLSGRGERLTRSFCDHQDTVSPVSEENLAKVLPPCFWSYPQAPRPTWSVIVKTTKCTRGQFSGPYDSFHNFHLIFGSKFGDYWKFSKQFVRPHPSQEAFLDRAAYNS